jgi:hypothetical protein
MVRDAGRDQTALGTARQKTAVKTSTSNPDRTSMSKSRNGIAADFRETFRRRDALLASVKKNNHNSALAEPHIDGVVWEEWLDGNLSDAYVERQLREHPHCVDCRSNYEYFKALKASTT